MANTVPENMNTKTAMAINQDELAKERTQLSITRTELAFITSKMALNRTHLSYLRTIVTLIGTSATIFKALPAIGVSITFSTILAAFLLLCAIYFIYKDATVYPKTKRELAEMEARTKRIEEETENKVYEFEIE